MKKIITSLSTALALLFFIISCEHEKAITPVGPSREEDGKIARVVFNGISVQDTLKLHYEGEQISSINWCSHVTGDPACTAGYTETRYYNSSNDLELVNGRWNVFYFYEGRQRKRIMTYEGGQFFSSTNFEYAGGSLPAKMKVYLAGTDLNEATIVDFTFNTAGDLTGKKVTDKEGNLLADLQIVYSEIENPLQGKIETIPYAVEYFDFEQLAFYYSKHVPLTITNSAPPVPGHAVPHSVIHYALIQDDFGRLSLAAAFYNEINVHSIQINYGPQ